MRLAPALKEMFAGEIAFMVWDPRELSFWQHVAQQKLYVRVLGRRWIVRELEWTADMPTGHEVLPTGYRGLVQLQAVLPA
jgi:hypothetical protein